MSLVLYVPSLCVGKHEGKHSSALMKLMELLQTKQLNQPVPHLNLECVNEHCLAPSLACVQSSECRESLICYNECWQGWENDTTKQKLHIQNCTNICAYTYADEVCENVSSCYTHYGCISFPPIPNMCLANDSIVPIKRLSIKNLAEHRWWVVKGLNKDFDCNLPRCQATQFKQINSTWWDYEAQYEVDLRNGSIESITQHFPIPNQPPNSKNISFILQEEGLKHSETWWLLNEADDKSWIAMYYCANNHFFYFEGATVFSRDRTLSNTSYQSIFNTYKSVLGIDYSHFCDIHNPDDCFKRV